MANKQNGNGGVILDRAKVIADEMRATALKLAEQGRELAKAARQSAEELESKADALGAKAIELFDELAHESIVKIERSTAALKMIEGQQLALLEPVKQPATVSSQATNDVAGRVGTGVVEAELKQLIGKMTNP
jgi:hypothetical protein